MIIKEISDIKEKKNTVRYILEALPDWFGLPDARENYIKDSENQICLCAIEEEKPLGVLTLKETGKDTLELAVMGILQEYHRKGIGRKLVEEAMQIAKDKGYSFLQVKTVEMGRYDIYDDTNKFYLSLGFKEFEVFPTLWGEQNPCQIYIMALN